jgi:hypothetical protein
VGLERSVIVEAMLACLVYDQLGKVQLWRAQLQQCIPNFYDSIADQRVLLQALKDENRDNLARFLPSFASLQVLTLAFHACTSSMQFKYTSPLTAFVGFSFSFSPSLKLRL